MHRRTAVLIALAVVGALAPAGGAAEVRTDEPVVQAGGPLRDPFFAYDRPADHPRIALSRDVRVPVRDGSFIACDLRRPAAADGTPVPGRFPGLVVEYHAYAIAKDNETSADHFVRRGYNALVCDARGSGNSPGELDPFSPQEQRDNYDVIEWLAAQPWSTGKVGQTGVSYGAHTSFLVAADRPPHLTTIVPVQGIHDWYENTIYRGGVRSPSIYAFELTTFLQAQGGSNPTGSLAMPRNTFVEYNAHPLYDGFWRDRSVQVSWDRLDIPVLGFGGWYDRYRDGMTKNQAGMHDNAWLVMGPWTHGPVHTQAQQPVPQGAVLAWFDHWLKGDEDAPLPAAKVTSYETAATPAASTGWYQYGAWPVPQARRQTFHLTADRALARVAGTAGQHSYVVDPFDPGNDRSHTTPVNQGDQREEDQRRLTYTTPPLSQDTVLVGAIDVVVTASTSASDGNLVVRLMDVAPDGTSTRISAGWKKISHRTGHDRLAPVVPGQSYDVPVQVWPQHYRFGKGHSIRLSISSGDFPEIAADAPPGTVTVLTGAGGSRASLPLLRAAD